MIFSAEMLELGSITIWPSAVRSFVYIRPISSTLPVTPAISARSPREMGREVISMMPPARLDSMPWIARETAREATPSSATRDEEGTPRLWATMMTVTMYIRAFSPVSRNFCSRSSIWV